LYTLPDGFFGAESYRVYVQNPSDVAVWASDVELVVRQQGDAFKALRITIPRTAVPPLSEGRRTVTVTFEANEVDVRIIAGIVVDCDSLPSLDPQGEAPTARSRWRWVYSEGR